MCMCVYVVCVYVCCVCVYAVCVCVCMLLCVRQRHTWFRGPWLVDGDVFGPHFLHRHPFIQEGLLTMTFCGNAKNCQGACAKSSHDGVKDSLTASNGQACYWFSNGAPPDPARCAILQVRTYLQLILMMCDNRLHGGVRQVRRDE